MLSQKIVAITSLLIYTTISNATPGDAAYKAGQFEAAAKLYKLGSEQGDAEAALKLGLLLEKTKLTDYVQSGEWYIKACNLGNNVGCHNAGYASEDGLHGLTKNHLVAESYYRKLLREGICNLNITWVVCMRINTSMAI